MDAHPLASCLLAACVLWTFDRPLARVASPLQVSARRWGADHEVACGLSGPPRGATAWRMSR